MNKIVNLGTGVRTQAKQNGGFPSLLWICIATIIVVISGFTVQTFYTVHAVWQGFAIPVSTHQHLHRFYDFRKPGLFQANCREL